MERFFRPLLMVALAALASAAFPAALFAANAGSMPDLIARLQSPDSRVAFDAQDALVKLGKNAVLPLTELATNPKAGDSSRFLAASALQRIGPEAADSIPALIDALESGHGSSALIEAFPKISTAAVSLLCDKVAISGAMTPASRIPIIEALGKFGPSAESCFTPLFKAALGDRLFNRTSLAGRLMYSLHARYALMEIAPQRSVDTAKDVFSSVTSSDDSRVEAGEFLSYFGPLSIQVLLEALESKIEANRVAGAVGLSHMATLVGNINEAKRQDWMSGLESAIPACKKAMDDSSIPVRDWSRKAFENIELQKKRLDERLKRQQNLRSVK